MTPEETARSVAPVVTKLPSRFMLDGATFVHGASVGFQGMDFYVAGRGGVLGDVDADVVSAAFFFFEPTTVRTQWELGLKAMPAAQAALEFAGCCHRWADAHLPEGPDYARLASLLGRIVHGANPAALPIFAGWRALPEPEGAARLALHHLNALRELRAALHGAAVLSVGLTPMEACVVNDPGMAVIFGWPEPFPDAEGLRSRWHEAEARTDAMMGVALGVLDAHERDELVALATAVYAAAV